LDADPPPRPPLPAHRSSAPERDPRRVGAAARGARNLDDDGGCGGTSFVLAGADAAGRRAAALAHELLRLARAARLRRRASSSELADPRRARVLLRDGDPRLVAARAGSAAAAVERPAGGIRVRGVRPLGAARAPPGAASARGLRLLRALAAALGAVT